MAPAGKKPRRQSFPCSHSSWPSSLELWRCGMLPQPSRVALFGTVVLLSCGMTSAQTSPRDRLMEDLRRTMATLAAARAAANASAWSQHVADEFVLIHGDGRIHDRAEEIAELKASK